MVAAEVSEVELDSATTFCPTKSRRPKVKPVPAARCGCKEDEEDDVIILLKESVETPVVRGQNSAVQSCAEGLPSMVVKVESSPLLCVCLAWL